MLKLTAVAGAVLSIALVGCGGGGGGGSPATVAATSTPVAFSLKTCDATGVASVNAMYTLTNQQWQQFTGSALPKDSGFTQCVDGSATTDGASDTITWNSGTPDGTVLSYPSVVYGSVPGYNNPTPSHLPASVTALPSLKVNGTVATTCSSNPNPCKFDTAFDMYLADQSGTKDGEIMIWTESAGQTASSYPGYLGRFNIGGNQYDVINRPITITNIVKGVTVNYVWKYLAFVSVTPIQTFTNFDIAPFIAFGLDTGSLNHLPNPILTSDKLASIEMGTEVISGSGTTTITNYSIK